MATSPFITAGTAIRRALGVMGLPAIADVPARLSTDATARQMWALLLECGQELYGEHEWRMLKRTQTINTSTPSIAPDKFALPDDWKRYIDETGWNNSARLPLLGPISDQQWRMLKARGLGASTLQVQYTLEDNYLVLYAPPPTAQTLQIDYLSRGWVQDAVTSTLRKDAPTADADIVLYDPRLIVSMLKFKWRSAKGFDTTAAQIEYNKALDNAKYDDQPKKDLDLSGQSSYPYLGVNNISDTGYGT